MFYLTQEASLLGTTELTTTLIFCIYCTVESSSQVLMINGIMLTSFQKWFQISGMPICSCCPKIREFRSRIITRYKLHRVYCEISLSFLNGKEISMTESSLCGSLQNIKWKQLLSNVLKGQKQWPCHVPGNPDKTPGPDTSED